MSKQATITISVAVTGDGNTSTWSTTLVNAASPAERIIAPITAGRNNIFLGTTPFLFVVVIPPANSSVTKTWDASSTTGGPLNQTTASVICVPSGTTTINIGASGSESLELLFY